MEIYYFSGTGNTLHVVRELKLRFPKSILIPIISTLKKRKIETKAETVGIVFPIHALSFPWPVRKFLQKVNLKLSSYIFAIATRECFTKVFSDINKLLSKQNKSLNAYFSFEMPVNYIPIFNVYSQKECNKAELEMKKKLDFIEKVISNKKPNQTKDPRSWFILSHIIYPLITLYFQKVRFLDMQKAFYADYKCNSCGICEKICLSGKIKIIKGKPQWEKKIKCTYCFACLHYCPVQAIQIRGRKTKNKKRYHHPQINIKDIIEQKNKNENKF